MIDSAEGTSDLIFVTGKPPQMESFGRLSSFDAETPLSNAHIQSYANIVISGNERLARDLQVSGSCDCSYSVPDTGRFRVNVYKQNGNCAMVLRKLQSEVPSLTALHLPSLFKDIIREKTGLVFVTGGTGSGKTTTLAAMLNELNKTERMHIVTLEDPVEFVHSHDQAIFSQREFGRDFFSFADALRAALRQAPKVILVGEIRDRETMEVALTAAETGHVVFSSLHTISAAQTVNRILGMFSKEEEVQVRHRLADTLRYVISQRLVPRQGGGRYLATEVMGSNMRTRETIALGESDQRRFSEIIEANESTGWHSFEQSLLKAFNSGAISEETAVFCCTNKSRMRQMIDAANKQRVGMESNTSIRMKTPEEPLPELPFTLKLKGVKTEEAPEPVIQLQAPPEVLENGETFEMVCPKCDTTSVVSMRFFDQLVTCPACQCQVLARPLAYKAVLPLEHSFFTSEEEADRETA